MVKSLDGIKKLNPDDIKKYRKIVLNYIGENDSAAIPEQKKSIAGASAKRRVDGVNLNKTNRFAVKAKEVIKKAFVLGETKAEPATSSERQEERMEEAIKRQKEERKKIEVEERQYGLNKEQAEKDRLEQLERLKQEKIRQEKEIIFKEKNKQAEIKRAEEAKKWAEKIRLEEIEKGKIRKAKEKIDLEQERVKREKMKKIEREKQRRELAEKKLRAEQEIIRQEELKKKEIVEKAKREVEAIKQIEEARRREERVRLEKLAKEKKRIIEENLRLEKQKREEEVRIINQEIKIKNLAAREKKKIKRQKAWRKTKRKLKLKMNIFFSEIKKNIIYLISLLILCLAIAYLIFCLAVLRFKTNNFVGWAANYLPVPAVITSQGIISYNDFRKIEDNKYLSLNLAEKKVYLAKAEVTRDLRNKYGLSADFPYDNLAIKYVLDKNFNQVGLSRINKINELLKEQNSLESLSKYADEYNDEAYYDSKGAWEKLGSSVLELAVGQTSQIIPRINGYYILKRINDKNGKLVFKQLFVKALTLDQYVAKEVKKIRIFILAD